MGKEMNTLINELTTKMSRTTQLRQVRELKDAVEAHEKLLAPKQRAPQPSLNVKPFQDLRDHLADRKALEEVMGSHTCDKQILVRKVEEPKCACNHSCSSGTIVMLAAGVAVGLV